MDVFTNKFIHIYLWWLVLLRVDFCVCTGFSKIICIPSEKEALVKIKQHLKDPSNRLASWSGDGDCCKWPGVVCSNVTSHVLELQLGTSPSDSFFYDTKERSRFGGKINPSLLDLKHLQYLDIGGNDFGGMPIPSFLGSITSLTHLKLSRAGFSGNIPPQIGNLSNLLYLDLGNPSLPWDELLLSADNLEWLSSLSSLQYLDLSYANISGAIDWLQVLQNLPSLKQLHLDGCPLHYHNQPHYSNSSSLATLDLSYTDASFIPQWIFNLRNLISLHLGGNKFQGQIPDGFQNLTSLEELDLSFNQFNSSIPYWLYGMRHLKFLSLGYNNLLGNISEAIGNLTSLVFLDLINNQLEGKFPTSFGNLCKLRDLQISILKSKQEASEMLEILSGCASHGLERLVVNGFHLTGPLTDRIGVFKKLALLDLFDNCLQGALPESLGNLSSLRYLSLTKNQFSGNPFEILGSLSKLEFLWIDENLFQGTIKEAHLANFTRLEILSASANQFTLKIGHDWVPPFQIGDLHINSWHLGPRFPSWLLSQKHLDILDISNSWISDSIPNQFWETFSNNQLDFNASHNYILGELPNTLKNPINFESIDLSSNQLSGQLPYISPDVVYLDLSSNRFSGCIIDFLCQKQNKKMSLEFLNLASNNLSGKIPNCWMMWPNLVEVNLGNNHFTGKLPTSMGSLSWLNALHLHNNKLSGHFPAFVKNSSKLIFLNLGENEFSGIIPKWVGQAFSNLKILRLRSNNFVGQIPCQICALNYLQILDIAQNSLSGDIPKCFNHLKAMTIKNSSSDPLIHSSDRNGTHGFGCIVSVHLWLKGSDVEYAFLLGLVTSIDLSDNKLSGEIPKEITNLSGLYFLNLSNNLLAGQIPDSIGNMGQIEVIDLSRNQLSGEIPSSISNLNFLSMLDLSFNHLEGKIPTGTQIQSFQESCFVGNHLCGPPLPINCTSNGQIPHMDQNDKESATDGINWFFVGAVFGFIVGFWIVAGPLLYSRSWRYAYFRFLDRVWYKLQCSW